MIYSRYIEWKSWSEDAFGLVAPGTRFHFDQIFRLTSKRKLKVLEIGFGNGELLGYFRALGHHVVGIEINDSLVERAIKSLYPAYLGCVWEISDLQSIKFDILVAFAVAEHMHHSDLLNLFSWASEHLSPGGKLYLKFPEGASPFGLGYQNGDFTHVTCLTKPKIKALCNETHMELISYKDEPLVSNKLCSLGVLGFVVLYFLQAYSVLLKMLTRILFLPVCPSLRLATNSIAIITVGRFESY